MKKKIANTVMVFFLLVIVAGGILYAGSLKGWFESESEAEWSIGDIKGIVILERKGVAYTLNESMVIRVGDTITCKDSAYARVRLLDSEFYINGASELEIKEVSDEGILVDLKKGEVFVDSQRPFTLTFDSVSTELEGCVASVSVRSGAATLNVFKGETEQADALQKAEWVNGEKSSGSISIYSLNEFNIECLLKTVESKELFVTKAELERVVEKRNEKPDCDIDSDTQCSITIVCDTILDNMESLDPAKGEFVPESGTILPVTAVDIEDGDTVFEILNRVCKDNGIQIEYSWTPLYDSYYIEGINNLYEFDCGYESGWMYKVNGWFPNYGCSDYTVQPGDSIVWCYTCVGLGEDVGDTSFGW